MRIMVTVLLSAVLLVGGALLFVGCLYSITQLPDWLLGGFAGLAGLAALVVVARICWEVASDLADRCGRWL